MVCWTIFWYQINSLIPHALFQDNKFTVTPLSFWCHYLGNEYSSHFISARYL